MATSIEAFANKFHELDGITLGERTRSFNNFFRQAKQLIKSPADENIFIKTLTPKNRLENNFYISILLHYKRITEIFEILYGNDVFMKKKLMKCPWFYKDAFRDINETDFVNTVLYKSSFAIRMKVLNRVCRYLDDEKKMDGYFRLVKEFYGLHVAKLILPGCSMATIISEVTENRIIFTNNQLEQIYGKSEDFVTLYFDKLEAHGDKKFYRYDKLVKVVQRVNCNLYWSLVKKHKLGTKMSQKMTREIARKFSSDLIADPKKYLTMMNKKQLSQVLNREDYKLFYKGLFPLSLEDYSYSDTANTPSDLIDFAKLSKSPNKFQLFDEVFTELYDTKILEHSELISEPLLELVPVAQRDTIIDELIEKAETGDDWVCFYETQKSLGILKEKIARTSDQTERRKLVALLVKTCEMNNQNLDDLSEVLKHIITRHKNEDPALLRTVIGNIRGQFKLSKLQQRHWDVMNDVFKLYHLINCNTYCGYGYVLNDILAQHMIFKNNNGESVEGELLGYLKETFKDFGFYMYDKPHEKGIKKVCLNLFPRLIVENFTGENLKYATGFYISAVKAWNCKYRKEKIDLMQHEFVRKFFHEILDDGDKENSFSWVIRGEMALVKSDPEIYRKLVKSLWKSDQDSSSCEDNWMMFLKDDPKQVVEHYEKYFTQTLYARFSEKKVYYKCSLYSHLGIPQLFLKKSVEILSEPEKLTEDNREGYVKAVKFLAMLDNNVDEYLKLINPYLCDESGVIKLEESKQLFLVQEAVGMTLGWVSDPCKTFEALLRNCRGDYLKSARSSLYKVNYHTAEYQNKEFLAKIASGSVSVRKHAMFIISQISNAEHVINYLTTSAESEQNFSVRKYLLKTTWSYLQANPKDEVYKLLKHYVTLLNERDVEGYELVLDLNKVPRRYLEDFIPFIWNSLADNKVDEVQNLRYKLITENKDSVLAKLNNKFVDTIVEQCFTFNPKKLNENHRDTVYDFVCNYLATNYTTCEDAHRKLTMVMKELPPTTNTSLGMTDIKTNQNMKYFIYKLCDKITGESMKTSPCMLITLTTFIEILDAKYKKEHFFEQLMYVKLSKSYVKHANEGYTYQLFAEELLEILESLQHLGGVVIMLFAKVFREFLTALSEREEKYVDKLYKHQQVALMEILSLCMSMSGGNVSNEIKSFVLLALPKKWCKSVKSKLQQEGIIKALLASEDEAILIPLHCYINSFTNYED